MITIFTVEARGQLYVGLHGGVTLPQGYYADSRMSDNEWMFTEGHQRKAGAGKGWNSGVDISFAMPFHPSLEVTMSADFMQSAPSRDVRDYYEYVFSHRYSSCSLYEMELPKLRNIPILLGARYAYPVTVGVDLYGEALAGVNFRSITDWRTCYADADWVQRDGQEFHDFNNEDVRSYASARTFAFRLGAGFIIKKMVTVGASYTVLGSSPLSWDRTQTTRYSIYGQEVENTNNIHVDYHDINPTMVVVNLGFRLNPFKGARHVQDW